MVEYVPERGDVVWLEFNPQSGHEQAGRRPAIVLSPKRFNEVTGFIFCCPITSKIKGYPFEVKIEGKVSGVALSDQIKSLDFRARNAKYIQKAPRSVVDEIIAKIKLVLEG